MGDVDDPPAADLAQMGQYGAGAAHRSGELEVDVLGPLILADVLKLLGRRATGVVDQNIDPPVVRGRLGHKGVNVFTLGDIGRDGQYLAAGLRPHVGCGLFEHVRPPSADGDLGAFPGETHGDSLANPFAATGNESDLAL